MRSFDLEQSKRLGERLEAHESCPWCKRCDEFHAERDALQARLTRTVELGNQLAKGLYELAPEDRPHEALSAWTQHIEESAE